MMAKKRLKVKRIFSNWVKRTATRPWPVARYVLALGPGEEITPILEKMTELQPATQLVRFSRFCPKTGIFKGE